MMDREQLIGTWRLVDFLYTDAAGKTSQPENGMTGGLIIYTADGYVAMATQREDGGFLSYFGRYEVGENHLVHHVEMSPDAALVGTRQQRAARLEDGRLVLTASPTIIGGPGTSADLVWQRV
jgi:hypothetical protein